MTVDLGEATHEHCRLFNQCVRSGDWAPFLATFTPDAELELVGRPSRRFTGKEALSTLYRIAAPTEPMRVRQVSVLDDHTVAVDFTWKSGEPGTMRVSWQAGLVSGVRLSLPDT